MSEENVEIVRRIHSGWERRDFFSLPELFDASLQATWIDPVFVRQSETRGLRETARSMRDFLTAYERASGQSGRVSRRRR